MLKLTPTLLGHPTVKLGRLLQIFSTNDLGKCTDMLSEIYKVANNFLNSQEQLRKFFWLFGTNWKKMAILAWGDPAQIWLLKQGTDPTKYQYEGLDGNSGQLLTYINFLNFIPMHKTLIITKMARLVKFNQSTSQGVQYLINIIPEQLRFVEYELQRLM